MSNKLEAALHDPRPDPERFQKKAKACVLEATKTWQSHRGMTEKDLYVVWFSKTLRNWKALISTDFLRGNYYEVTYDGEKQQAYVDVYNKHTNTTIFDEQLATTDH